MAPTLPSETPEAVVNRLPLYCRLLSKLRSGGRSIVSSHELAAALDLSPSLVRKDLAHVGRLGRQGNGYLIDRLERELRAILGLERRWRMVLVGTGRLGQAIAAYPGFAADGFDLDGLYDTDPTLIGLSVAGSEVRDVRLLERDLAEQPADIGLITVPASEAQRVADVLVRAGVGGVLNYAPVPLRVPAEVALQQVDPVLQLQCMTYRVRH